MVHRRWVPHYVLRCITTSVVSRVVTVNYDTVRRLKGRTTSVVSNGLSVELLPLFIRKTDRVRSPPLFDVSRAMSDVAGRNMDELKFMMSIVSSTSRQPLVNVSTSSLVSAKYTLMESVQGCGRWLVDSLAKGRKTEDATRKMSATTFTRVNEKLNPLPRTGQTDGTTDRTTLPRKRET